VIVALSEVVTELPMRRIESLFAVSELQSLNRFQNDERSESSRENENENLNQYQSVERSESWRENENLNLSHSVERSEFSSEKESRRLAATRDHQSVKYGTSGTLTVAMTSNDTHER